MPTLRIGIIGDFDPARPYHRATNEALHHAANSIAAKAEIEWVPTIDLQNSHNDSELSRFDAFFAAPGSPYRSIDGALRGIQFALEHDRPFVGT